MTATTERCPGCHGTGTEPSGTTHAGIAEHLACGECGPDCPQDCGCRDIDNVSAHMFRRALRARARILRDRAQAIREGR